MNRHLLFLLLVLLAGPSPALGQDMVGEYLLGPKDLVELKVLEIPELNVERRVSDGGTIDVPLIGQFPVSGLSAQEVKDRLEALLQSKYVNRANVSLVIKEYANKPVSILGAVQRPGSLNIAARWDLLQAISAAGGLGPNAGRKIFVIRRALNGLTDTLEIKTDDLFRGSSSRWNIPIFPSDVVNIPARSSVKLFCLGEVKNPGAHEFDADDRITILSVIAKAGGLTERASKTIRVKRKNSLTGKDEELLVDYNRIISGKDEDPSLRQDDVVIVKTSFL